MKFPDESYDLRIELNTENCELSDAQIAELEAALDPLRNPVRDFPVSDLYLTIIFHPRSNDYHVKTSLVLTGRTLFTGSRDTLVYPAFERCVRKLLKKLKHYKADLGAAAETAKQEKGTHQEITPSQIPDQQLLQQALEQGDYAAFRRAMYVYEEPVRQRVGRLVQRYPEIEAQIGERLSIEDLVEETFLNAFDQFEHRPNAVRLGEWLEQLADDSLRQLMRHPAEELENIRFARTMQS